MVTIPSGILLFFSIFGVFVFGFMSGRAQILFPSEKHALDQHVAELNDNIESLRVRLAQRDAQVEHLDEQLNKSQAAYDELQTLILTKLTNKG